MSAHRNRQTKRLQVAKDNGYTAKPVPVSPDWALDRVTEPVDTKAARAARKLRGLKAA